jgi:hypothetical protein
MGFSRPESYGVNDMRLIIESVVIAVAVWLLITVAGVLS